MAAYCPPFSYEQLMEFPLRYLFVMDLEARRRYALAVKEAKK